DFFGIWFLVLLVIDDRLTPEDQITLDDGVRMALLVILEQLTPAERTTFVLHDVFGLDFADIAHSVGRTPESCRQLASRARRRIAGSRAGRFSVSRPELRKICDEFARACADGNLNALMEVLDPHVSGDFDSGGLVRRAPLETLNGSVAVAEQLIASFERLPATFRVESVNGEPGVVVRLGERIGAVLTFVLVDGLIREIFAVGNPDKLRHLQPHPPPISR
ncbi:sigma factor-like helix-turn-helix DNA-binding protein, partial [Nocardia sp. NPDC058497]|uniref:sigma factor-like helix-turn-helix DNA-binding protein n=1 Tax=Nocardia sp. NPDC058497 TaxID=3346529 RepID=UPI003669FE1F